VSQLRTELIELRASLSRITQRREYEEQARARQQKAMNAIEEEKTEIVQAVALIDKTIAVVSANGIGSIESTVSKGLQMVFADPTMAFKVNKKDGARGTSYFIEVQQGDHSGPILETFGGGVANVVSFLLRVIMIKRFKLPKFLSIDEQFNNISAAILPRVSKAVKVLVNEGGYTVLAVTHQPILAAAADRVYHVESPGVGLPPTITDVTHSYKGLYAFTQFPDEVRQLRQQEAAEE
jgi:DNA repair ATPase RecN